MSIKYEPEDPLPEDSEPEAVEMINIEDGPGNIGIERTLNPEDDPPQYHQWARLPSPALENIYSYLNRKDQCQMSLVCTGWSKEFSSPSVWKTLKFCLPDRDQNVDICPEVKFAKKYSNMFRNVEIISTIVRVSILDFMARQLELFLRILTFHSQLLSVKFRNIGNFFRHLDITARTDMLRTFVQFLESQRNLRTVEFHASHFTYEQAAELVTAITTNSATTVRKLVLRGFTDLEVANPAQKEAIANSLSSMFVRKLLNLSSLEIEYSQIFESMLSSNPNISEAFKNIKRHDLSRISLHCEGSRRTRFEGIPSTVWRNLKQSCPHLEVDLYFIPGTQPHQEIEFYLVPDIPLRSLDYRFDRLHATAANIEIDVLFNHLRHIGSNLGLESLYLIWMRQISDLSAVLVPFLQSCPLLKCLQLFVCHPVNGVELVLQSWMDVRPKSLKQVLISISHVTNQEDYLTLTTVVDEYVPILQVLGLDVYVILEPSW